ncbi:hypothetical protein [Sagittula sp. SSi028]|uniref:hypothetical protein n=1 Tax=Sagittula sp. SSi028 TaxID=3400636 RepID=UPI003AF93403
MEAGSWELWAQGDLALVLDVDPHVAFAYLLRNGAMLSSVWLCNLPGPLPDTDDEDALPVVAAAFVLPGQTPPRSLDDLDVSATANRWTIRWPAGRAVLSRDSALGWSSGIRSDAPFAHPLRDLPPIPQ